MKKSEIQNEITNLFSNVQYDNLTELNQDWYGYVQNQMNHLSTMNKEDLLLVLKMVKKLNNKK